MRLWIEALVLAVLLAAATFVCGWWGVPVGSAAWVAVRRRPPWVAGLAAGLAWGGWLLTLPLGPLHRAAGRLGAVFSLPGPMLLGITLLYGVLLAWSTARLARALCR